MVVTEVRNIRATFRVPLKEKVSILVRGSQGTQLLTQHEKIIQRLGSIDQMKVAASGTRPAGSVVSHLAAGPGFDSWDLVVPLAGLVDLAVERQRIQREMENLKTRAKSKRGRLEDATFRSKAPPDVVAEEEASLKELETELAKWTDSLEKLKE